MAKNLAEIGFNLNLGTVLDLKKNSPIIAKQRRSFSENPKVVAEYASKMLAAHHEQNIISVVKHYPGHGSSTKDSHKEKVNISDSWQNIELYPYKKLIKKKEIEIIMSAHVIHNKIDPIYPATLSKKHIHEMLRKKLKFKGLIMTDDLQMKAIQNDYSETEAAILALQAGCNILLFANHPARTSLLVKALHREIKSALKRGEISKNHLEESYQKVLFYKKKYINQKNKSHK